MPGEIGWICETCGVQAARSLNPPPQCPICSDERQAVVAERQRWIRPAELAARQTVHFAMENGVTTMTLSPGIAINQRAFLIPHAGGNIMWECLAAITDEAVAHITALGGVTAIAVSHPHFYGAMIEWSEALGGVPVYVHANDRAWVQRTSPTLRFWRGDRRRLTDAIELTLLGGHFDGSAGLIWTDGPNAGATLFGGDAIQIAAGQPTATFMYSYPRSIPLPPAALTDLRRRIDAIEFENTFGFSSGRQIIGGAKVLIDAAFDRAAKSNVSRLPEADEMLNAREGLTAADIPWVPLRDGLSMRPLHFEEAGYALQLKLEPGTVIPPHRHTGVVHALNLSGRRQILGSGEVIGPGDFLFEAVGNVDSWRCHGDEPCVIQISLTGRVEYMSDNGAVESYSDSATARAAYLDFCRQQRIEPDHRIVGTDRATSETADV